MKAEQLIGLDNSQIINIEDNIELLGQKFQCHQQVLVPLAKLLRQSEVDGIPIKVVSSYRSFDYQVALWNKKFYQEQTLNLDDGSQINSQDLAPLDRVNAILKYSAVPGTSRHHWGTDFDIFDFCSIDQGYEVQLTEQEFSENGPCYNVDGWLHQYMNKYQFFRPYESNTGGIACEPWHISYRPLASQFLQSFPVDLLKKTLQFSEVGGKEHILAKFEQILEQYVFNICD